MSTTPVLHYIYDPLCGWCYGAKPLIDVARDFAGSGPRWRDDGWCATPTCVGATARLRDAHDHRIAQYTGQPFGEAYFEGLLRDTTAVFDSQPPTTAVLAAEQLAGRGLESC